MNKIKKGDIVGRISYNKDVVFEVTNILKTKNNKICILKGITERIEADSPIEDLEILDKRAVNKKIKNEEDKLIRKIKKYINKEVIDDKDIKIIKEVLKTYTQEKYFI